MSSIRGNVTEKIFSLTKFLGLHESKSGDTTLKFGEASEMRNFKISIDQKLKKRNGTRTYITLPDEVNGLWFGVVDGKTIGLAAGGNELWKIYEDGEYVSEFVGGMDTENQVSFIEFRGQVYILNGKEYLHYDGTLLDRVEGYVPVVLTEFKPNGECNTYENINKLTANRKVWLSPDGTATSWTFTEPVRRIIYAKNRATGNAVTYSFANNAITFTAAPSQGTNTIEVMYESPVSYRSEVEAMNFGEAFTGTGDARLLFYGDGGAEILYSDIDYQGNIRADYFPEMNEVMLGASNDPITSLIRYSEQIVVFKQRSTYRMTETSVELSTGLTTVGFSVKNANKAIGNSCFTKTFLMTNNPISFCDGQLYQWSSGSYYSNNLSYSETQCKKISDNVYYSMSNLDEDKIRMYVDNKEQELWITDGNTTLVYNYTLKCWYKYSDLPITSMCRIGRNMFLGLNNGKVVEFSDSFMSDDGVAIDGYWESGSVDFGNINQSKFSAECWVGYTIQGVNDLTLELLTDKGKHKEKSLKHESLFSFASLVFSEFSFNTNTTPRTARLKAKAKKMCYIKIMLTNDELNSTCCINNVTMKVRFTGTNKGNNK